MTGPAPTPAPSPPDEKWRRLLNVGIRARWKRRFWNRIPSSPRCKMCAAPFSGIGGLIFPHFGHPRWSKNPKYCAGCYRALSAQHGGAEIECSLLFADVRGSTALAEQMSARDFTRLMDRFYDVATTILVDEGAVVDKFVGDEVIGIFIPAMATESHGEHAIRAGRRLLTETGHGPGKLPWLPVGIGINTAVVYVGSIGLGMDTEMTAMGDAVNTTARLSSVAYAGEILVPVEAALKAGEVVGALERRSLDLKGKAQAVDVVVLTS